MEVLKMASQFIKLNVEGMSCSHCVNAVKKAVSSLVGIHKVEISLDEKTVSVEFDPGRASMEQIREAIDAQGYEVK